MPDLFKPLFSPNLLARRLTGFAPTLSPELTAIADQWARTAADPAFLNLNEKPLHSRHTIKFGAIGCSLAHIRKIEMDVEFDMTSIKETRTRTTLTFRYIGGSRPGDIRTVRPKELFQVAGFSGCYILADDLDLAEERVFRLDRIDWQP